MVACIAGKALRFPDKRLRFITFHYDSLGEVKMGVEDDPQMLKKIYDKGYSACIYGEPRKSPYHTTYQLWACKEWKRGYDDARKKHKRKYTTKKFDLGMS